MMKHTLSACGKSYHLDIGGGGCDKRSGREPIILEKGGVTIYCYGQDSTSIFKDKTQLILTLADGHGPLQSGKAISYRIHELIIKCILDINEFLVTNLKLGNYDIIKSKIKSIFNDVNKSILYTDTLTSKYMTGGTTLNIVHKIIDVDTGELYTISSNVGDSSYLKIENNHVREISQEQNCDNIVAIEEYYNHCLENDIEPSKIILGRFNTPGGFLLHWVGYNPIEPYKYSIENGKYHLSPNIDAMKQVYELAPPHLKTNTFYNGGPQSIRGRSSNLTALANGQFPMENFGSTIEGDIQMVSSFGDKKSKQKYNIMCIPYINISKQNLDNTHDFISSDGVMDCLTNPEIIRLFSYKNKMSMTMDQFCEFLETSIDIQARLGGFKFTGCLPSWDDISYWVVKTRIDESLMYRINKLETQINI